MTRWYLDTSAAIKLVVRETESEALAAAIDAGSPELVACWLLDTEMRRAAHRLGSLTQETVSDLLGNVDLYEVPASLFREAGLLPGADLRSLDALHLSAAVRLGVDQVVTYDRRQAEAARSLGLGVLAPT